METPSQRENAKIKKSHERDGTKARSGYVHVDDGGKGTGDGADGLGRGGVWIRLQPPRTTICCCCMTVEERGVGVEGAASIRSIGRGGGGSQSEVMCDHWNPPPLLPPTRMHTHTRRGHTGFSRTIPPPFVWFVPATDGRSAALPSPSIRARVAVSFHTCAHTHTLRVMCAADDSHSELILCGTIVFPSLLTVGS